MLAKKLELALHAAKDIAREAKEKEDCVEYAIILNNMEVSLEWLRRKDEDNIAIAEYKLVDCEAKDGN